MNSCDDVSYTFFCLDGIPRQADVCFLHTVGRTACIAVYKSSAISRPCSDLSHFLSSWAGCGQSLASKCHARLCFLCADTRRIK